MGKKMVKAPHFGRDYRKHARAAGCVHGTITCKQVIVHTAECFNRAGYSDIDGVEHYLEGTPDRLMAQFITDGEGRVAWCGNLHDLMYHCAGANSISVGIEQVGFASTGTHDWLTDYNRQLRATSHLIAWIGQEAGFRVSRRTVKGHYAYPQGGHHDPGQGYPLDRVIRDARYMQKTGKHLAYSKGGLVLGQ